MMSILKKFILSFLLLPSCLVGMEHGTMVAHDRHGTPIIFDGKPVILEWHKVDYPTFLNFDEQLTPIVAESFADNEWEFLLDHKTLAIKEEYAEAIRTLSPENWWHHKIAIAQNPDRTARVECWQQETSQYKARRRNELLINPKKYSDVRFLVVIAKNEPCGDILGFVDFKITPEDAATGSVYGDTLAIAPTARAKGLAQCLAASILTLEPRTRRIHFETRIWNLRAQALYRSLGCTACGQHDCAISFEICDDALTKALR